MGSDSACQPALPSAHIAARHRAAQCSTECTAKHKSVARQAVRRGPPPARVVLIQGCSNRLEHPRDACRVEGAGAAAVHHHDNLLRWRSIALIIPLAAAGSAAACSKGAGAAACRGALASTVPRELLLHTSLNLCDGCVGECNSRAASALTDCLSDMNDQHWPPSTVGALHTRSARATGRQQGRACWPLNSSCGTWHQLQLLQSRYSASCVATSAGQRSGAAGATYLPADEVSKAQQLLFRGKCVVPEPVSGTSRRRCAVPQCRLPLCRAARPQ